MEKRGRKPKPKVDTTPKPQLGDPYCPPHLDTEAKKEWKRVTKILNDMGLLATSDHAILAAYCQQWSRCVQGEKALKKEGYICQAPNGFIQCNKWVEITNKAYELMTRYADKLGLSPASRQKIKLPEKPPAEVAKWEGIIQMTG